MQVRAHLTSSIQRNTKFGPNWHIYGSFWPLYEWLWRYTADLDQNFTSYDVLYHWGTMYDEIRAGKNWHFAEMLGLTLSFPQPPLFFCKFSNPQFLAQFNQVPLMPINQFLSSQTEAGHSQHAHIPCHSYIVSQIKLIVHFLDNLLPRQVERPDLVEK